MNRIASPTLGAPQRPTKSARATWRVRTAARFDALTVGGGGEVQQTQTEQALRELGVDGICSNDPRLFADLAPG